MGTIADAFSSGFRDYATDGDPASGAHKPVKSDLRALGATIESVTDALSSGVLRYEDKATLDADTGQSDGTLAYVTDDATPSNNGLYVFTSGSPGSWAKTALQFLIKDQQDSVSINAGQSFPLKSASRDSAVSTENADWKDFLLSVFVINAQPGFVYRVARHYGPTQASAAYGWIIERHEESVYDSASSAQIIHNFNDEQPAYTTSGRQTVLLECPGEIEKVVVTIDADQNPGSGIYDSFDSNDDGYSWIIDPSCYIASILPDGGSLELNGGLDYPLQNRDRDGNSYGVTAEAKSVLLDARVFGAKPGKLYRIEYIADEVTGLGAEDENVVIFAEYDRDTFATSSSKKTLHGLNDQDTSTIEAGDIVTRHFVCADDPSIQFSVTYRPGAITGDKLDMQSAGDDYGLVIHPANYVYATAAGGSVGDQLLVRRDGDELWVVWRDPWSENDFRVKFKKFGQNDLLQFGHIYTRSARPNLNLHNAGWDEDWTTIYQGGTDWIGPIKMNASSNGDSEDIAFVGGNHVVNATQTASTASFSFFDATTGRPIRDGEELATDRVFIHVHNEVMAANTVSLDRTVMDERVTYSVTRYGIAPMVNLTFRENVLVEAYYGMQADYNDYWTSGEVLFAHSEDLTRQAVGVVSSGTWDTYPNADRVVFTDSGLMSMLMWLDTGFGIAGGEHVNTDAQDRAFLAGGKAYFNLIRTASGTRTFTAGQTLSWRGCYVFSTGKTQGDLTVNWLRDASGEYVLLVDAVSAVNTSVVAAPPGSVGLKLGSLAEIKTGTIAYPDQVTGNVVPIDADSAASLTLRP